MCIKFWDLIILIFNLPLWGLVIWWFSKLGLLLNNWVFSLCNPFFLSSSPAPSSLFLYYILLCPAPMDSLLYFFFSFFLFVKNPISLSPSPSLPPSLPLSITLFMYLKFGLWGILIREDGTCIYTYMLVDTYIHK